MPPIEGAWHANSASVRLTASFDMGTHEEVGQVKDAVRDLMHGVVISCQAYEDTPLYGSENMARMAQCAVMGGADGIRACWPNDIRAIKQVTGDIPIIGINKVLGEGDPLDVVFITPDFESAKAVVEAGCDILGVDCTIRPSRGFDQLKSLLEEIHAAWPSLPVMADLATAEEAARAESTGLVDIISTTLAGYTRQTSGMSTDGPGLDTLREVKATVSLPVNAEGRIWELHDLQAVIDAGADMVTIGTAVTRPHLITRRFVDYNDAHVEG